VRWNGNHGDSGDDSGSGLAFAVLAAVQARGGDVAGARRMLARARRSTMDLCAPARWFQIVTRAVQATACVPLGDVPTARLLVRDARQRNDSGEWSEFLGAIIDHAERAVVDAAADHSLGSTPLTTAELRVLRYLPTQLSFPEIAGGLFVSRHTIKTQALAVYHKLGVSSRTAAVDRARDLGLLPELPVGAT
jgi:LuxR family maltose regulon positive regulatory protein